MIATCNCKHKDQDELHGKNQRIHTLGKDDHPRCTIYGPIARKQQRLKLHAATHVKAAHG